MTHPPREVHPPETAADGFAPPPVTLPKGGGALRGLGEAFAVGAATGTASCTVPVVTTPGRDGFGPALALAYDSGAGNGPYGLGWTIRLPAVTRKTDKVLPRYRDDDVFLLSDTEDLVLTEIGVDAGAYLVDRFRPRTEGMSARIERWRRRSDNDEHWRVIDKANVTTVYGMDTEARIADGGRVWSWLAQHSVDALGNACVYEYKAEDSANVPGGAAHEGHRRPAGRTAQRYIKRIRYGNRVSALLDPTLAAPGWAFEVVFDYGEHDPDAPTPAEVAPWPVRADAFSRYKPGFEVRTYRLCRRVLMFHHFPDDPAVGDGALVRATEFGYAEDPAVTLLASVTSVGYRGTVRRALPPLSFDYSPHGWHDAVADADAGPPAGLATPDVTHVDLDGEGIAGLLYTGDGGWRYGANLGGGRFSGPEPLPTIPTGRDVRAGGRRLTDVTATGTLDLVDLDEATPGYFARDEGGWAPFAAFGSLPRIDFDDPNLRLVDLDGDGRADALVTGADQVTWYPSRGTDGFGPATVVSGSPRLVFADATESLHAADMTGDGLADLVRVRAGQVVYWPNLGFGRFGDPVVMDEAGPFARADAFDPRYVRLADVDGTGTADVVYLDAAGARIWRNLAGNAFAPPHAVALPPVDDLAAVDIVDLLGTGTACLVWSSPLPAATGRAMRYVDLLGSVKPYLLTGLDNHRGTATRVRYASSTRFMLADKAAGRPWATRLPFPVHVVDRVDVADRISRNWLTTRYAYHHGCFDPAEREFRGFGMVERWDAEQIGVVTADPPVAPAPGADPAPSVPPTHTRSWYHTGVLAGRDTVSRHYAAEYWSGGVDSDQTVPDTVLPTTVLAADGTRTPYAPTAGDLRDAVRALRGSRLREEIYGDGDVPYKVTESNYAVELLVPRGTGPHAVCLAHPRETVEHAYERTVDPRTVHRAVLAVDGYGNVRTEVEVAYPRRVPVPDPGLSPAALDALRAAQGRTWIRVTETDHAAALDSPDAHRAPRVAERREYEIVGLTTTDRFTFGELVTGVAAASDGAHDLAAEIVDAVTPDPWRRLVARTRTRYRADDLAGPLPAGQQGALGLVHRELTLAATPGQLTALYTRDGTDLLGASAAALAAEGGYLVDADGWWAPTGTVAYSPNPADPPAAELAHARAHFFRPYRFTDPFGATATAGWDADLLVATEATDAAGNVTAVTAVDYRVVKPAVVADANGNRTAVAYDAFGRVAAGAVMGKDGEGDSLAGVDPDPDPILFLADPLGAAAALLGGATTRFVYDDDAYRRTGTDPAGTASLARTRYTGDPTPGAVRVAFDYTDGTGRVVQHKAQAEPGPVVDGGPAVAARWTGSGWTVHDNKGNPVRRYEPFFSATHRFEDARATGVSVLAVHDPLGRVAATVHQDASWTKTVRDAWTETGWDRNDTTLLDPRTDPDVAGYLAGWAAALPAGWRTWHEAALAGDPDEVDAAAKAAAHAGTPSAGHVDPLGRPVCDVSHLRDSGGDRWLATWRALDVRGNALAGHDERGRLASAARYDLAGRAASAGTADGGTAWTLYDVAGRPMRVWSPRGPVTRVTYDALRRPARRYVTEGGVERLRDRTVYGEAHPAALAHNLRTQVYRRLDGAGLTENSAFDFAGNATRTSRRLAADHRDQPDWSAADALTDADLCAALPPGVEPGEYATVTAFDALRRPVAVTSADASVTTPRYTEADRLGGVDVAARGAGPAAPVVASIGYNARGQRTSVGYGNGAATGYTYDPRTFRLTAADTVRPAPGAVQGLRYHYDPVGNVTRRGDAAQPTLFYAGAVVDPGADYGYDSLYRLISATGREHVGQAAPDRSDAVGVALPLPGDGPAMRRYAETYAYDDAGNLTATVHRATNGNWTRTQTYAEPSAIAAAETGNRLTSSNAETFGWDAHGNLTRDAQLAVIDWDDRDRLRHAGLGGGGDLYAHYDAEGRRTRKVVERPNGTRRYEWIYLDSVDVYREYDGSGTTVTLERQTLHVHDGEHRFALLEARTAGTDAGLDAVTRYQLGDHLDSSCAELDEHAALVSYEEYYPYGGTSYRAVRATTETPKRYRYTARERDPETGFTYHGARYCAPWLGRWISPDPAGSPDGLNRYAYARDNPVRLSDPTGTTGQDGTTPPPPASGGAATTPAPAAAPATPPPATTAPATSSPAATGDAATPAAPPEDQVNLWNSSMIQGSGRITAGKMEEEGFALFSVSNQSGLGASGSHWGGGVSTLGGAFRYQLRAVPGLDLGGQLTGSLVGQGSGGGTTTTRGGYLGPTAHWGIKSEGGFGLAVYGNAGYGVSVAHLNGADTHTEGLSGQALLALSYERDPTGGFSFTGLAVNGIAGGATAGGLSQGPTLTGLSTYGGTLGLNFGLGKQWGITAEGNLTRTAGTADATAPGQSASSLTWRAGLVGTYSWGPRSAIAGAVGFGAWVQSENGSVTGPATTSSPTGGFNTTSVLVGVSIGGRGVRVPF